MPRFQNSKLLFLNKLTNFLPTEVGQNEESECALFPTLRLVRPAPAEHMPIFFPNLPYNLIVPPG